MEEIIYIHYGSSRFDPQRFVPIKNCSWKPKPEDGTGLWACRVGDEHGWKSWCRSAGFRLETLDTAFKFTLKSDAKVLTLEIPSDLLVLPKLYPWNPGIRETEEELDFTDPPTVEQMMARFAPHWCFLNYEKLSEEYDAIELRNSYLFHDSLNTWDCDSIVVMNPDVVEELT